MSRFPDPHARLGQVLADAYGGQVIESRQTPWASATFSGARHSYLLRLPIHANLDTNLNERDFELPGHILADITFNDVEMSADAHVFAVEALTVEDA